MKRELGHPHIVVGAFRCYTHTQIPLHIMVAFILLHLLETPSSTMIMASSLRIPVLPLRIYDNGCHGNLTGFAGIPEDVNITILGLFFPMAFRKTIKIMTFTWTRTTDDHQRLDRDQYKSWTWRHEMPNNTKQ